MIKKYTPEITPKELEQLFEEFNGMKVLVIGDVMIDAYLWGKVDRISPEAPGVRRYPPVPLHGY